MYLQSDTEAAIRQVQAYLYEIYQYENLKNPPPKDGSYGNATREAVTFFQQREKLTPTGVVDLATFEALRSTATKYRAETALDAFLYSSEGFPLKIGTRGADIEVLHALLRTLSEYYTELPPIPRTSYFSQETEKAVRYMQKVFLYNQDGTVDRRLFERLEEELRARRGFL